MSHQQSDNTVIVQEREQNPLKPSIMCNSVKKKNVPTSDFVIGRVISLTLHVYVAIVLCTYITASKSGTKSCLLHHACCSANKWDSCHLC
jgi:hypothetical protein